jgi:predicted  nucleic acid-binding Zn-ribbon protein
MVDDEMKKIQDEMIKKLKELKFNQPDIENLRRNAVAIKKKIEEEIERTKKAYRLSDETLNKHFTF